MNPIVTRVIAASLLSLAATIAFADVYRWTDANGRTVYGDSPPAGVKAHKVEGGVSVVPAAPVPEPGPTSPAAPAAAPAPAITHNAAPASNAAEEAAARRERLIARCKANRGVDCEQQVDAMIDGPSSLPDYVEPYPVWGRAYYPPVRPIPPKPKPHPKPREPLAGPLPAGPKPKSVPSAADQK
jgi:hypothetical protein